MPSRVSLLASLAERGRQGPFDVKCGVKLPSDMNRAPIRPSRATCWIVEGHDEIGRHWHPS